MNHLKKIEDRVISILKTNVDARSDDMMLYLLVCNSFYSNENSVGKMPFEVVMKNYKELELPHFESVRRTRAKIQSEHPELACSPECRKEDAASLFQLCYELRTVISMENEKRKVGDYTVLCAVNIGSREIILAENEQSANGERFLCCYGERNDIFEKFSECAVGDDYIDAALFFAERIKKDAEQFRAEVEKLDIPVTVITQVDCIPDHYKNDINGKIIAINPAVLKPEYQRADRQLYYVTGGFGASANARGSAVFCKNLYDGKNTRFERMDVLGEIKPERMPDWAKEKAAAFSRTIQGKDHER